MAHDPPDSVGDGCFADNALCLALYLAPTRELAEQVCKVVILMGESPHGYGDCSCFCSWSCSGSARKVCVVGRDFDVLAWWRTLAERDQEDCVCHTGGKIDLFADRMTEKNIPAKVEQLGGAFCAPIVTRRAAGVSRDRLDDRRACSTDCERSYRSHPCYVH